jgi:tetratricopeptide (TPR) repeat protein
MTRPEFETILAREVPNRLLRHRPDLSMHRLQRRRARDMGELLGCDAAAVEALGAWLGTHPDSDVRDLEGTLGDRAQLALARLSPKERRGADGPGFRAETALLLCWEVLRGSQAREVLHVLASVGGGPLPAAVLDLAVGARPGSAGALASGLARGDEHALTLPPAVLWFVEHQPDPMPRPERQARFLDAVRDALQAGDPRAVELDAAAEVAIGVALASHMGSVVGSIAHRMCDRLRRRGAPGEAWAWAERGLQGRGATTAHGRPLFALLEFDLGLVALEQGATDRAEEHLQRAVDEFAEGARRDVDGAAPLLRHARTALAQCRLAAGRGTTGAEADLLQVLADWISEGASSPHRLGRASIRLSLAARRLAEGRGAEAEPLLAHAALDLGATPADAGAVALLVTRAQTARAAGRIAEASQHLEQARVLAGGDLDRSTSTNLPVVLHDLGVLAADRGDPAAAATLLDEAAMMASSLLPATHPLRGLISRTRAVLFIAEGESRRGALAGLRAREALERALPPDHVERALTEVVEAWARLEEGSAHWDDVRSQVDAALPLVEAARGAGAPSTVLLRELRQTLTAG